MKMRCKLIPRLAMPLWLALTVAGHARAEAPPLQLTLVAEHTAISPGQPFTLGLFLEHQEGYHSYWKAPGIVGLPTSLAWELPKGFTAGALQWPVPAIVDMRGHAAYGYQEDTLLLIDLNAPTHLKPGDEVTLRARAGYMCCSQERCVPGFEDLTITLPVRHAGKPRLTHAKWEPVFDRARARLPKAAPTWGGSARVNQEEERYEVRLEAPADVVLPDEEQLYWFSTSGLVNSEVPQSIRCQGRVVTLSLARHPFADPQAESFAGILRSASGWPESEEKVLGLAITVPISRGSAPGQAQ